MLGQRVIGRLTGLLLLVAATPCSCLVAAASSRACHAQTPARSLRAAAAQMQLGGGRALFFSELDDEKKAINYLRRFPSSRFSAQWGKTDAWNDAEWQLFGIKRRLQFAAQPLPTGVRMLYYLSDEALQKRGLSGLVEDGYFELTLDVDARRFGVGPTSPAIRARAVRGVEDRSAAEDVVWNRLVYDLTKPRNSDVALGKVQGLQGANPVIAQKFERIDRIQATDSLWRRGYE